MTLLCHAERSEASNTGFLAALGMTNKVCMDSSLSLGMTEKSIRNNTKSAWNDQKRMPRITEQKASLKIIFLHRVA
jgi:hypothetical protein